MAAERNGSRIGPGRERASRHHSPESGASTTNSRPASRFSSRPAKSRVDRLGGPWIRPTRGPNGPVAINFGPGADATTVLRAPSRDVFGRFRRRATDPIHVNMSGLLPAAIKRRVEMLALRQAREYVLAHNKASSISGQIDEAPAVRCSSPVSPGTSPDPPPARRCRSSRCRSSRCRSSRAFARRLANLPDLPREPT
jgi:hypothetical protein